MKILHYPDESVISLRAIGIKQSKGQYILITEDHCIPNKNWTQKIETFLNGSEEQLIGGTVLNGSDLSCWDRANYWITFCRFTSPSSKNKFSPCIANLAFKRSFIVSNALAPGEIEMLIAQRSQQEKLIPNIGNPVHHIQSHGSINTIAMHYHNGRSCTGITRNLLSKTQRIFKFLKILALPLWLLSITSKSIWQNYRSNKFNPLSDTPLVLILIFSHTAGELCGLLFGAGKSPQKLK